MYGGRRVLHHARSLCKVTLVILLCKVTLVILLCKVTPGILLCKVTPVILLCKVTPVILLCKVTPVILHGVVSSEEPWTGVPKVNAQGAKSQLPHEAPKAKGLRIEV